MTKTTGAPAPVVFFLGAVMSSTTSGERPQGGEIRETLPPAATHLSDSGLHADSFDVAHALANLVAGQSQTLTVQEAAEALLASTNEIHAAVASGQLNVVPSRQTNDKMGIGILDLAEYARSRRGWAKAHQASSRSSPTRLDLAQILARWREQGVFSEPDDSLPGKAVSRKSPK